MSKKILFSPIGGTDPIKYFRDGSMLHICRHYRPDVVYLYLSHEMMEFHRKDNRYVDTIHWLGEFLGHSFEVRLIERDELVNVQKYDIFYEDFREEIGKIERTMEKGDELLLNMASGSPAMKSALFVMGTFAEYRFKPILVSSPLGRMNAPHEERSDYDKETVWQLDEDNLEGAENRCEEARSLHLVRMLKIEIIKKHILAYDYGAALTVAAEIEDELPEEVYDLIRIMDKRVGLERSEIGKLMNGKNYDIYPIREGAKQQIFEYALVLQMKLQKKQYADFIRGITPLVVDLLEDILKNKCNIKLDDCCAKGKDNVKKWSREKLQKAGLADILEHAYGGDFKYGPVYSGHIAKIIAHKCGDAKLTQQVEDMVYIEGKVRNVAAHEIVSVTDEWIQRQTRQEDGRGKNAHEIFQMLKYLMREAGIHAKEEDWKSYDRINERIVGNQFYFNRK